MSSDWNEEEEDQAKDKDSNQKHAQTDPSFFAVITITLKPTKPFITKYFDSMTSKTLLMYTPKEKHRCDTIVAQQEWNATEHGVQNQDSSEDIG